MSVYFELTIVESLFRSPWQARSSAIILLEQAESRLTLGPLKLKNQLSLFASKLIASPVTAYLGSTSGSFTNII